MTTWLGRFRGSHSFRTFVTALMLALVTGTVAVLLLLAGHFQRRGILALVDEVADQTLGRVELRVEQMLGEALLLNRQAIRLMGTDANVPGFIERWGDYFAKSLEAFEGITQVGLGLEATGEYVMARRMPGGGIEIRENVVEAGGGRVIRVWRWGGAGRERVGVEAWDGYDPRTRPYYGVARARGASGWTETYRFWDRAGEAPRLGVSFATPWRASDGRLLGVLNGDFDLRELCRFLGELDAEMSGYPLIVEHRRERGPRLIAHPRPDCMIRPGGTELAESLGEVLDPVVVAYVAEEMAAGGRPSGDGRVGRFEVEGRPYLGAHHRLRGADQPPWSIALVIEADAVLGDVRRTFWWSVVAAGGCLLAAWVAVVWLARRIARPLQDLTREARSIGELQFDDAPVRRSPIREVGQLAASMGEMKASLRSFRKYVPADLVHQLVATGLEARLGGRQAGLTLFFSDIAGFTAISESHPPQQVVEWLGDYLAVLSGVIHEHGGTVDKFIGDGVMAFWGAPQPHAGHAEAACRAAWEVQRRLAELEPRWVAAGRPRLPTRIGLHTGEAVVGNIGSEERMNYTVIGDAVNVASRMEGLNKAFGTQVLLTEATCAGAGSSILARPVSRVLVHGKARSVLVFELMAVAGRVSAGQVEKAARTVEAFGAWERGELRRAWELYEALWREDPRDGVARAQLKRCEESLGTGLESATEIIHRVDR